MKKSLYSLMYRLPTSLNKQEGATMVEYAIMVALIAIVAIAAVALLGTNVSSTFNRAATSLGG
jgi:pilus assembly protein Flp/PilA